MAVNSTLLKPCPMVFCSAFTLQKGEQVLLCCTREDSADAGLNNRTSTESLCSIQQIAKSNENGLRQESLKVFEEWPGEEG